MTYSFDGKVAIITGGSSAAAMAVVDEIKAAGGEALANGGSVSDRKGAASMVQDAVNAWGRSTSLKRSGPSCPNRTTDEL